MNKSIIVVIIMVTFNLSNLLSQDLRNNLIGKYQCNVSNCSLNQFGQYDCQNGSDSILIFKKVSDSTQIEVFFADNSHFILSKENDSTYTYSGIPYVSALFYSTDSVRLSRVHSSIGYSIYKGRKISNSIIINPQSLNIIPYPNPFNNQIIIENLNNKNWIIYISDLNGRFINVKSVINENKIIISTENINKGVFFLRIISSSSLYSYKMVKL